MAPQSSNHFDIRLQNQEPNSCISSPLSIISTRAELCTFPVMEGKRTFGESSAQSSDHKLKARGQRLQATCHSAVHVTAADLNLTDIECCYKVFHRVKDIIIEKHRFGFEPEIIATAPVLVFNFLGRRYLVFPLTGRGEWQQRRQREWISRAVTMITSKVP